MGIRRWRYNDLDGTHDITDNEILKIYYPYWKESMKRAGKEKQINEENCIEDFVIVNWAWEVKDGGQTKESVL